MNRYLHRLAVGAVATLAAGMSLTDLLPTGISAGPCGTTWVIEGHVLDFLQGRPSATFTIHQV
jgi:hypothetical protein